MPRTLAIPLRRALLLLSLLLFVVPAARAVACAADGAHDQRRSKGEPGPRVVEPSDRREFYRGGWRHLLGRRIHLHVETEVLRHAPERIGGGPDAGRPRLRFKNRSVALVIDPRSPYWRKLQRDLNDCSEVCLHGVVRAAPSGARASAQLEVDTIVRAPGSRRKR
jgi:hypothetical protein